MQQIPHVERRSSTRQGQGDQLVSTGTFRATRCMPGSITPDEVSPGMPYPSRDRAVNLSALHAARCHGRERNLSGIIIFIRICDSSRARDIYLADSFAATPTALPSAIRSASVPLSLSFPLFSR